MQQQLNVLGTELQPCSYDPRTGYYRTGCCENRGDDPGLPTVFFTQSFCQKSAFAHNLAREHGGLYVEVDKVMSRSTRAKIEAFLEFNLNRRRR